MSSLVPWKRTTPRVGDILAGAPVRGRTWQDAAGLLHWVRAHGMHIIPAHNPGVTIATSGTRDFVYRIKPQGLAIARVWTVVCRGEAPSGSSRVRITYPDAATVDYSPRVEIRGAGDRWLYVEDLSSKGSAQEDVTLTVANTSGTDDVYVESIACFELPRALLTLDATDRGVNTETNRAGQAIYQDDNRSAYGVVLGAAQAETEPRRQLIAMAFSPVRRAASGYSSIFPIEIPVLPRKQTRTDTTRTVTWNVEAYCSDGTTAGSVQVITGRSANTDTITVPAGTTSPQFHTNGTVELDCEDLSKTDGLPGASDWETVQFDFERSAGSGEVIVQAISMWEHD